MSSPQIIKINELDLDLIQPSTKDYMNPKQGGSKIVVIGKPGCFAKGTPVLMYDGTIKNIEDVLPGDLVMGPDSSTRNVLELCRNVDEMYKITPVKGDEVIVNKNHILTLKCTGYNSHKKGEIIDITVSDFLKKSKTFQKRYKWFRTGVDFAKTDVEWDPYTLGLWLGDGTSRTSEFTTIDEEVVNHLKSDFEDRGLMHKKENSGITYHISSKEGTKGKNHFINFLRKNNLQNKHIPHNYKVNSRECRLSILAGLLDSDGYYDKKSNVFEIVQKREILLDDIIFIARSLGFSAYKTECEKVCTDTGSVCTYYRCHISGNGIDEIPTKLGRKQACERKQIEDNLVTGFSLTHVGQDQYYGFTLDGDHRFLLGDFSVVHNTGKTTLITALLYGKKHIIPVGAVTSGTEDSNGHYGKMFPSSFVFNQYSEENMKKFRHRQKIAKKHLENPWAVILLDDCTDKPAIFRQPLQQDYYKNGRHWKMLYIVSLQYCMDVLPVIRTTVDGTFILREPNLKNRKSLYENYAGVIPDFSLFCDIMDQITDDYTALYIHNATIENDWQKCVFWYKARQVPEGFKFGSPDYWSFHFDRYNAEYVDPIF